MAAHEKDRPKDGLSFLYVLVETRAGHRVSMGEFRALRSATRFHLDGPGCAPRGARELVPWTPIVGCGREFPLRPTSGTKWL